MNVAVVVFLSLAGLAYLAYFLIRRELDHRRSKAVADFALKHELEFSLEDTGDLRRNDFGLFRRGDDRTLDNVVTGMWRGVPIQAADYAYTTESSGSSGTTQRTTHDFSIALTRLPAKLPWISIGHESFGSSLMNLFPGLGDIEYELAPFNDRFRVKADDEDFARQLIDPAMMHWLLIAGHQYRYEVNGDVVLAYCDQVKPPMFPPLFDHLLEFTRRIPAGVIQAYQSG